MSPRPASVDAAVRRGLRLLRDITVTRTMDGYLVVQYDPDPEHSGVEIGRTHVTIEDVTSRS